MRTRARLGVTAWLAVVVGVWLGVDTLAAHAAATAMLYLQGDGVPTASLAPTAPTGPLVNLDPGRDDHPGLLVQKGGEGPGERDPVKHQRWVTTTPPNFSGPVRLVLWAAMKDFDHGKRGELVAYLRHCPPSGCRLLGSDRVRRERWHRNEVQAGFEQVTFQFGNVSFTPSERAALEIPPM